MRPSSCPICFMHFNLCLCEDIPKLNLKTKLSLLIHTKELKRTSNTGSLAVHALTNSEMRIRGIQNQVLDLSDFLDPKYHPLFFFPAEDALELSPQVLENIKKPIQLIVPDGNWRQAAKVYSRHSELKSLQKVMIKTPNLAKVHMRAESTLEGMATLQAIALAFGVLEGEAVKQQLMNLYELKLRRTLIARGQQHLLQFV